MKLTESQLRGIIREEAREMLSEARPISPKAIKRTLTGYSISDVTVQGEEVSFALTQGGTTKILTIGGNPEFTIERL